MTTYYYYFSEGTIIRACPLTSEEIEEREEELGDFIFIEFISPTEHKFFKAKH